MVSRLEAKLKYDEKIAELHGLIQAETKKLQDVIEQKDSSLRDVAQLIERKARLVKEFVVVENKIIEAERILKETIDRKTKFIETAKQELVKEKNNVREAKELLVSLSEEVKQLHHVVTEYKNFIAKEHDAHKRYIQEKEKLDSATKQKDEFLLLIQKQRESIDKEKKDLDAMKVYISDLYGKLASYVTVAKETIEDVNKTLEEKNVPLHFDLPPGEILKIDFNNFNKYE